MRQLSVDIGIIGAGPAGLAAAASAARSGLRVGVLDDNPLPGGQIWRDSRAHGRTQGGIASHWLAAAQVPAVHLVTSATVIAPLGHDAALVETPSETLEVHFSRLILATGARERFLPFPGWTLPGVMGTGGLQALVKGGFPVAGRRVIVAGTGPLLLAVATYLKWSGAQIRLIAEQTTWPHLIAFAPSVAGSLAKMRQAGGFARQLRGVSFKPSCWVVRAYGRERLEAVELTHGGSTWVEPCDYLACGFGLVPNIELPAAFGCTIAGEASLVDEWQQTNIEGVYAAGEVTGVGGVEASLAEGMIAGFAAADDRDAARRCFAARDRAHHFAAAMDRHFALRPKLRALADEDTIICRCEDVTLGDLRAHTSWRSAKLHTRCGMGPCQGRVCGPATAAVFGWTPDSVRPPVKAARLESLVFPRAHSNPSIEDSMPEEVMQ